MRRRGISPGLKRLKKRFRDNKAKMRVAVEFAARVDRGLLCTDKRFSGRVLVVHCDGSRLCIENAFVVWYKRVFVIVFAEHFNPMVFFVSDLRELSRPRKGKKVVR